MADTVVSLLFKGDATSAVRAAGATEAAVGRLDKRALVSSRSLTRLGLTAGGAFATGLGAAVFVAGSFEKVLDQVQAVSGATEKQMDALSETALDLGAKTKFSAREAAQAEVELAKAGLSTADILGGALKGSLSLAAAGNLELADAASFAANAMNLFGLKGKDVSRIADGLATAANTTTADVQDFGMALTQGGAAAKGAGLSFQETVTILEALAAAGVKNSDAGTSMKAALLQLINPTRRQAALAKELGFNVLDANGQLKSAADLSEELRRVTVGLTRAERLKVLATLAGTDGVRTLLALYDAGPKKLARYRQGLEKVGTAEQTAAIMNDNLAGKVEQLQGSAETLGIRLGNLLIPALTDTAEGLTGIVNVAADHERATAAIIAGTAGLTATVLAANVALSVYDSRLVEATIGQQRLLAVGKAAGWAGIVAGIALVVNEGLNVLHEKLNEEPAIFGRARDAVADYRSALTDLNTTAASYKDAQLRARAADIAVERARQNRNQAIAQYGRNSLEARDAILRYNQAQLEQERATVAVSRAHQKNMDAQRGVAAGAKIATKSYEDLRAEFAKATKGIDRTNSANATLLRQLDQAAVRGYAKRLRELAAEAGGTQTKAGRAALAVADLTEKLGRLPDKKDIRLVANPDRALDAIEQVRARASAPVYMPVIIRPQGTTGIQPRASGGPLRPGGVYRTGERGEETIVMGRSGGWVFPRSLGRMSRSGRLGGGGEGVIFAPTVHVHVRGSVVAERELVRTVADAFEEAVRVGGRFRFSQ